MATKTVGKIKQRDLDPDLILALSEAKDPSVITSLLNNYVRKTDVISRNALPDDYVGEVDERIANLESRMTFLETNAVTNETKLIIDNLDDSLKDIILALETFVSNVKKEGDVPVISSNTYGDRVIMVKGADNNEYPVVIPDISLNPDGFTDIEKKTIHTRIQQLQNKVTEFDNALKAIRLQINGIDRATITLGTTLSGLSHPAVVTGSVSDALSVAFAADVSASLTSNAARLTNLENTVDAIKGTNASVQSMYSMQQNLISQASDISVLQNDMIAQIQYSDLNAELKNKINMISDLNRRLGIVEVSKMNQPSLLQSGYLYYSKDEGQLVRPRMPFITATVCESYPEVLNAQTSGHPFIIDAYTGTGYSYNEVTKNYDSIKICETSVYDNIFILDAETNIISYAVIDGSLVKLNGGQNSAKAIGATSVSARVLQIAAGSVEVIHRLNNLKKFPPVVLVHDLDEYSRTYDSYVSSEGTVTLSHNIDGFVIHNDSDHKIEVLIIMGD